MASLLNLGRGLIKAPSGLPVGAIDMGLPSGTLWAQGNIVKDANGNYAIGEPTDYGCFFSWGNIDGHNEGDGYSFDDDNYALTSGSHLTGDIPSDDALHDAAVARIGGEWHMPTTDNYNELFNSNNSIVEIISVDTIKGFLCKSKINANILFFPFSGQINVLVRYYKNDTSYYWTSITVPRSNSAYYNRYNKWTSLPYNSSGHKSLGQSIRPVYTPNN